MQLELVGLSVSCQSNTSKTCGFSFDHGLCTGRHGSSQSLRLVRKLYSLVTQEHQAGLCLYTLIHKSTQIKKSCPFTACAQIHSSFGIAVDLNYNILKLW